MREKQGFFKFDIKNELKKHMTWLFGLTFLLLVGSKVVGIGVNLTDSLPKKFYAINKIDRNVKKGQLISFRYCGEFYPHGTQVGKKVLGVPGDVVTEENRNFYINGIFVGRAKELSLSGQPIDASAFRGVIPKGKFWFGTDHVDSFDSRYAMAGLADDNDVIGHIIALF